MSAFDLPDYLDKYAGEHIDPEDIIRSPPNSFADNYEPATDADEALRFLKALRSAGPWVLTAIIPDGATTTRTFTAEQDARQFIETHNNKERTSTSPAICVAMSSRNRPRQR